MKKNTITRTLRCPFTVGWTDCSYASPPFHRLTSHRQILAPSPCVAKDRKTISIKVPFCSLNCLIRRRCSLPPRPAPFAWSRPCSISKRAQGCSQKPCMSCMMTNVESFALSHTHFHAQKTHLDQPDDLGSGCDVDLLKSWRKSIFRTSSWLTHRPKDDASGFEKVE